MEEVTNGKSRNGFCQYVCTGTVFVLTENARTETVGTAEVRNEFVLIVRVEPRDINRYF